MRPIPKLTPMVRFVTAPCRLRKWLSDAYSLRSGAVTNRTYRVGAYSLRSGAVTNRTYRVGAYSLRSGAVTNRTYRVGAKRLQTALTVLELRGYKPHLPVLWKSGLPI